jgi:hypothetical protein
MAVFGYIVYTIISILVSLGAFFMCAFASGISGKLPTECKVFALIAAVMMYGVFAFCPFGIVVH